MIATHTSPRLAWVHPQLVCESCEEGRVYRSRGANDPDERFSGWCDACNGAGVRLCDARWCGNEAATVTDNGDAYCADHAPAFDELFGE